MINKTLPYLIDYLQQKIANYYFSPSDTYQHTYILSKKAC